MLEREAREILGVTQTTSFSDIKKRYRQLAKVMHPDLAPADNSEQSAAAMGRINEAWATIEFREKSGTLGQPQESSETSTGRYPNSNECFMCGYTPAIYFKAPSVVSFFIWGKYHGFEGVACKNCGTTMSRLAAMDALRKGWWGLGILWMPIVIFNWLRNESKFKKLAPPSARANNVVTLLFFPTPIAKSPAKDPVGLLASAFAITILFAIFLNPGGSISSTGGVDPNQLGKAGTCYTQDTRQGTVGLTSCDNELGVLTSLGTASTQSACLIGTTYTVNIKTSDGTAAVACLAPYGGVAPSKICYSLDGQTNKSFGCSSYPQISLSLCGAAKYANFMAISNTGSIENTLSPVGGGVWKSSDSGDCKAPEKSFVFQGTEVRRVGTYKYRINFSDKEDTSDTSAKSPGSSTWTVVIS